MMISTVGALDKCEEASQMFLCSRGCGSPTWALGFAFKCFNVEESGR